jgi:CRISPR-associated endonuclease/helicase Cas3
MLLKQSFRSANGEFRVIDAPTRGVIVPYAEGKQIINTLCGAFCLEKQRELLKQAQQYSVNLFSYQFDEMCMKGAIREVQNGAGVYYLNEQYYSKEFGWDNKPVSLMSLLTDQGGHNGISK